MGHYFIDNNFREPVITFPVQDGNLQLTKQRVFQI